MTSTLLKEIEEGNYQLVKPNKIQSIASNDFYSKRFSDIEIPDFEAERCFVVIQEQLEFDKSTGARLSNPKLAKYDGEQWLHMTRQTDKSNKDFGGNARTGDGGLNPMAGYSIDVIHDPYLYMENMENKVSNKGVKETDSAPKVPSFTLDDLEALSEEATKELYEKMAQKKAGRLGIEKQREFLIDYATN